MTEEKSNTFASIELPVLKNWNTQQVYDYSAQIADYEDLHQLGLAINAARVALFKLTDRINTYERKERESKILYDREYRRAYLSSVEKTETQKRLRAELACEALENNVIVAEQLKSELIRVSYSLRLELQTLQSIGHNLRQQMKME